MQRYQAIYADTENYSLYFIDAETIDDTETIVVAQLYDLNYWQVIYMENTTTKGAVNQNELFEKVKSEIVSLGIIKE